MNKEKFENPDKTRMVYEKMISMKEKQLEDALKIANEKGNSVSHAEELAVYRARLELDGAKKRLQMFEKRLFVYQFFKEEKATQNADDGSDKQGSSLSI